jgi:hypothetical protein
LRRRCKALFAVVLPAGYPTPTGYSPHPVTVVIEATPFDGSTITMPEFLSTVLASVAIALLEALVVRLAKAAWSNVAAQRAASA